MSKEVKRYTLFASLRPEAIAFLPAEVVSARDYDALLVDNERLRMQLVACGVVALANTPESAAEARVMHHDYMSASCQDVMRAVDSEMALLAERDALKRDAERYQLLTSTLLADCRGAQMTTQEGALYRALNAIEHVNTPEEIDAIFDDALQGEQK